MAEVASAYVTLLPSAKGFTGKIDAALGGEVDATGKALGGRLSGSMSTSMKAGLAAGAVGILGGLTAVFKTGLGEVEDYQAGLSQLQAGIKSTGGAAGVTAPELEALASRIQGYSGQTDDSIVASEKLLLTFTNIKNQAGENNDIFNQATEATADLAARMGGDASGAAIQLGKALNDPVKGVTALTRVGVSFTEQQKAQIAAMVESGDILGAQKVILSELNKEFGGSAKAFGDTLPGQIEKTKREFEDVSQEIVTALLPAIHGLVGFAHDDLIPALSATSHFIQENQTWLKPLAETVLITAAAWKSYTVWSKVAQVASLLMGRTAATNAVALSAEAAAAERSAIANKARAASLAGPVGLIAGTVLAGKAISDSIEAKQDAAMREHLTLLAKTANGLKQVQSGEHALSKAVDEGKFAFGGLNVRMHDNYKAALDNTDADEKAAAATHKNTAENRAAAAAAGNMSKAISQLTEHLTHQADVLLAQQRSYDGFRKLLNDLPGVVKENGQSLTGYSNKAIANRDALGEMVDAINATIGSMSKHDIATGKASDRLLAMQKLLRRTAIEQYGSRDAVDAWLQKIHMMPGQTSKALAGMKQDGTEVGHEFGSGFSNGIGDFIDNVFTAGAALAHAAVEGARSKKGQDSGSPSRKMIVVGNEAVEGYAVGIERSAHKAVKAAQDVVDRVLRTIRQQVAPEITDPAQLADIFGNKRAKAFDLGQNAKILGAHADELTEHYKALNRELKDQTRTNNEAERTARKHANALRREADDAQRAADHMADKTKADKAAKAAAEDHARALNHLANQSQHAYDQMVRDDDRAERLSQHGVNRAERDANRAQRAADRARDAARKAAEGAAQAAQALVDAVQEQANQILEAISSFEQTISQGLRGNFSLGSLWGQLTDAAAAAGSDLAEAQQKVADAQEALTEATSPKELADATQALADAQTALVAAQTAFDAANAAKSASGLQASLDDILANTQNFVDDLNVLVADGVSEGTIAQIAQMGPEAGDALAQALIDAGPDAIAAFDQTMTALDDLTQGAAEGMARHFYGAGVDAMSLFIEGLISQFPELTAALQPILDSLSGHGSGTATLPPIDPGKLLRMDVAPGSAKNDVVASREVVAAIDGLRSEIRRQTDRGAMLTKTGAR